LDNCIAVKETIWQKKPFVWQLKKQYGCTLSIMPLFNFFGF